MLAGAADAAGVFGSVGGAGGMVGCVCGGVPVSQEQLLIYRKLRPLEVRDELRLCSHSHVGGGDDPDEQVEQEELTQHNVRLVDQNNGPSARDGGIPSGGGVASGGVVGGGGGRWRGGRRRGWRAEGYHLEEGW